jgi:hypothetical protein
VLEYLPRANRFVERASFNHPRANFSLCTIMGHLIYMVGGVEYVEQQFFKRDYDESSSEEKDESSPGFS